MTEYLAGGRIYEICPENIHPCTMKNRGIYWRRYKIQKTLYIGQWHLSPLQSKHVGTSHTSPSISSTVQSTLQNPTLELPSASLSRFSESHHSSEISSLSKVILVLRKSRSVRMTNLGCSRAESLGWFDFDSPKNSALDMMHERALCWDEAANHQLPQTVTIWVLCLVTL